MSQSLCSSCGNAVVATARFCPRCGASLSWSPPSAVDPSLNEQHPNAARSSQPYSPPDPYRQPQYPQYPQASNPPYVQQPVYQPPQYMQQAYGAAPAYVERKDRTAALLLAIFLGGWTWIYTYKRDSWKFWLVLVLNLTLFNPLWTWLLLFLPNFGLHLWAIIDVAVRPQHFYDNYPNG